MRNPEPLAVVCDSREQKPWLFTNYNAVVTRGCLRSGDYSLAGHEHEIALERKSLDDLVQSLSHGRDRFEREVERLSAMQFAAVLVEGSAEDVARHKYISRMNPASVLQSTYSWAIRYRVQFWFCGTRKHAEFTCFSMLEKYQTHIRDQALEREGNAFLEGLAAKRSAKRERGGRV